MSNLGFKVLTSANWLHPDEVSAKLLSTTSTGATHPDVADRWVSHVLAPSLSDGVPDEVQALFQVARAAIAYAFLFYPLLALGVEQLARVGEAAIVHKCRMHGAPPSKLDFDRGINWLAKNSLLTADEKVAWHSMRKARDVASHPQHQMIIPPGMALAALEGYAHRINTLFAGA